MSGTKGRKLPTSADVSEHQKVERYTEDYNTEMQRTEIGHWVAYSDYARLAARVEELEGDYADLYSQLRRWPELTAEITRLRGALKKLANDFYLQPGLEDIVQDALKETRND